MHQKLRLVKRPFRSRPKQCVCGCSLPKLFLQISENTIIDLPTGVVTIHMDQTEPRIPAIAVASGTQIYIYKNLKPYFKFQLPSLEVHPVEKELWAGECTLLFYNIER